MKRIALLTVFLFSMVWASAQTMSVKSFKLLPEDKTAVSQEGQRLDWNGNAAALIKIVTKEKGFVFLGGTTGIVDSQQRDGEIWVWVPQGSQQISIRHQSFEELKDYGYPVEIESGRCYELVLDTQDAQ